DKPIDPSVFAQTKQGLASANQKLAQQREVVSSMTLERDALQRQLQMLADDSEVKALHEENESLKSRVNELQIKVNELGEQSSRLPSAPPPHPAPAGNLDAAKKSPEARANGLVLHRDGKLVTKTRTLEEELADARRAAQTNADLVMVLQTALRRAHEEKDT